MSDTENFSKGIFRADCAEIRLHREGSHPINVAGPGHLSQDEAGNLKYSVHLNHAGIVALINEINRPRQVGTIVPVEEYLIVTARTYSGPVWESSVGAVGFTMGLGTGGIASGLLYEITTMSLLPSELEKDYAYLVVRDHVDFPKTDFTETQIARQGETVAVNTARDTANFATEQDEFVLASKDGVTTLLCTFEKGGVRTFKHIRIQEAMQFALGQVFQPCVIETQTGSRHEKVFRSVGLREKPARQDPPLAFRGKAFSPGVYEIAKAYYTAILGQTSENWHELSSHVYFLVQAGSAAIELQCLAIGVAAEAIAGSCFPSLAPVGDDFLKEVNEFQIKLKTFGLSDALLKRVDGAVGAMKNARTADKLRAFVQDFGFDKRLFQSWQRLRNTAAHGSKVKGQDIAETFLSLNDVLYLCYAMILRFCGYTGVRTDYSTVGSPEVTPATTPADPLSVE